jgi:hypothetical protein
LRLGRSRFRRRGGRRLALGVDLRDDLARADRILGVLDDLHQHPVGGRGKLEHHLVGLDVDQVLVAPDLFAFLLVPVEQRRLGDRLRELRHLHFNDHSCSRFSFSPASTELPPGLRKTSE